MFTKLNLKTKNSVSYATIINSIIGIVLSILIIVFNFIRSGLTSYTYGLESLGLLTIILGILPYLSSSHNGITSVSFFNLYDSVYGLKKQNDQIINQKIANFRPQYYFFGGIYLLITIILAFSFPFFFNSSGTIYVENGLDQIKWYEATIFILSNAVEIYSVYLVIPVAIILLFINKQSYIYNLLNIGLTVIFNAIIICLFLLVKNNIIHLSFIWMNVIVFALLGSKMLFLTLLLYPIRKRYFPWYQKVKPSSWKITKDNVLAVISQYFNQFSSDIFAILFIVYAAINVNHANQIQLYHNGDNHIISNDFTPSAVFSMYLMLITSSKEIVHCLIDAFIPSMAEHIIKNNKKINEHFFHRYQMLTVFITSYTISTFLLTIAFSNSLFLSANQFNVWLSIGLCVPVFIESLTSTYDHLLPIYGSFNKILKLSIIKAVSIVVLLAIFSCAICFNVGTANVINGLYISIICAWTISALILYFISRHLMNEHIKKDRCLNLLKQTSLSYLYMFTLFISSLIIFIIFQNQINTIVANTAFYWKILLIVLLAIVNFFLNLLNLYIFRKSDFMYYLNDFKLIKQQLKNDKKQVINN